MKIVSVQDPLLVSSANDGGVFLLRDGVIERLSLIDTTGMAVAADGVLWARQSNNSNQLRWLRQGGLLTAALADHPLDLHDVRWHDGYLYAVSTELNAVLKLDAGLVEVARWTLPGEPDSAHLNSICFHEGRLLASRFGDFTEHRQYKNATRSAGQVFDVVTGEVLLTGLSQPHSLTSHGGLLWLCDSEVYKLRSFRDYVQEDEYAFEGYTRGLAFGAQHVYVGLSRSRNDPGSVLESARIAVLDHATMSRDASIELPCNEIYDILPYDADPSALRAAALHEANDELAAVAERSADACRQLTARDERLARMHHDLAQANAAYAGLTEQHARLQSDLASLKVELADVGAKHQEQSAWASLLEAETVRLWATIVEDERLIMTRSASLEAWRAAAEALVASRSWRLTAPLRRLSRSLGRPAGIPLPEVLPTGFEPAGAERRLSKAALPIFGLAFPEIENPRVSIVVSAHGNFEATLACLRAINRATGAVPCEVILIDDASGETEMARFHSVPGLRYHVNPHNLGYLRSSNQAHHLARGEYIHFLNNDTIVKAGWLEALLMAFARFPECGLAGSRLVYPDGRLQEAGGIVWADGGACNFGRDDVATRSAYAYAHEADYVSGASILIRADLFRALGGFDERYLPAYYEDTDLAFRLRAAGRKVFYQPDSIVIHHEGLSHGTNPHSGVKAAQTVNREKFVERWRDVLQHEQFLGGEHVFLAKDRSQLKKTVLIIDRCAPRTDRDAGSRAIWQLMRVLSLQGINIKFWSHEPGCDPEYAPLLRAHGVELFCDDEYAGAFEDWIAEHGRYMDYVVLSRPLVAIEYIDAVRRYCDAPILFYGHDVHHLRFMSQHRVDPHSMYDGFAHHSRLVEEAVWRQSDMILYPAENETEYVREWLQAHAIGAEAETIPLFAYEFGNEVIGAGLSDRRNILFVAGFTHAPNVDGALWFVREVWPIIRHHHPDYRLCLVGSDPPAEIIALGDAGVLVTGHVPEHELVAYYHSARVVVAPLRAGAGIKGKVLEAMRFGVPCVTTSIGAQGLSDANFLRVADDVHDIARMVIDLIRLDDEWMQAAHKGHAFVRERFSIESVWRTLSRTIDAAPYADVDARRRRIGALVAGASSASPGDPIADPSGLRSA